jgi:hypothetical protein
LLAKTFTLASQMEAVLTDGSGKPAPDVRITRRWTWDWNGKTGADDTRTDAQGRFSFPEVTASSGLTGLIPHAPGVGIEFVADLPGGPLTLLDLRKLNYDPDGELDGRPLRLKCRSDIEAEARGFFWGTCVMDDAVD